MRALDIMTERDSHETVVELLPWFVNGTLGEHEAALVEAHVHECVQCFSQLQQERQLQRMLGADDPAPIASAAHGFERLRPRLDSGFDATGARTRRRWRRVEGIALAAGLAAVAVTALVWQRFDGARLGSAGDFQTLSEPATTASQSLDIVFAPELLETEMRSLLQATGAVIVNGPTELGRYTIRLDGTPDGGDFATAIEILRGDPRVRFVGPAFIEEAPE